MKISDIFDKVDYKALFIGRPGKGKSVAAASFPKPYIFDFDGRIRAVANYHAGKDIDFDTYGVHDFAKFYEKLKSLMLNCPYETIILDSYTFLADMLMQYSMDKRDGTYNDKTGSKGLISMPDIGDYKAEGNGLRQTMVMLNQTTAKYKIVTAHTLIIEHNNVMTKEQKIIKSIVTAGKREADKVPAHFDEVYGFETENNPVDMSKPPFFVARTIPQEDNNYKTTLKGLPAKINFTDSSFFEKIKPFIKGA